MTSPVGNQKNKFLVVFALMMATIVAVILTMNPAIEEIHQQVMLYILAPVFAAFVLVSIAIKLSRVGIQ